MQLVLSLSEEDINYISFLLEKEGKVLKTSCKENNSSQVIDALIKKNSGLYQAISSRLSPYICYMKEISSGDQYEMSFQEFQTYFGTFPSCFNESDSMNYIIEWCDQHHYQIEFRRKLI